MADRKPKENKGKQIPADTVQHDSSASNSKDLGLDKNLDTKKEMRNASTHRRGHSGSDGADRERGRIIKLFKNHKPLTMSENTRGLSRNGQRNKNGGPTEAPGNDRSSKKNSSSRGMRDTDLDNVSNNNRISKSSRLAEKTGITGSEYDGRLSDE